MCFRRPLVIDETAGRDRVVQTRGCWSSSRSRSW